jgi:hypothetical protein
VHRDFYSNNRVLLHRAIIAAVGLQLPPLYADTLRQEVPSALNRLLDRMDKAEGTTTGLEKPFRQGV